MDKWTGKVVLVTGASTGIGAAIAARLVEYGMIVVGCARNIKNIESMAESLKDSKGSLTAIQCDLSKEDQIMSMFEKIKNQFGGVDVCINNAGLSHNASLLTGNTDQWRHMYDINVLGVMICSREAVRSMQERGVDDGMVLAISSMGAQKQSRHAPSIVYFSTKSAIKKIYEGLRAELHTLGSHIRVASISPGLVETDFIPKMFSDNPAAAKQLYSGFTPIRPDDIADAVVYCLSAPVRTQITDILMRPTECAF